MIVVIPAQAIWSLLRSKLALSSVFRCCRWISPRRDCLACAGLSSPWRQQDRSGRCRTNRASNEWDGPSSSWVSWSGSPSTGGV